MTTRSIQRYLFPILVLGSLLAVLVMGLFSIRAWRNAGMDRTRSDLRARAELIAERLTPMLTADDSTAIGPQVRQLGRLSECRVTVMAPSGRVWGDTEEDPNRMENHINRPEMAAALATGEGVSVRYSNTTQRNMMYFAHAANVDGRTLAVVRTSIPLAELSEVVQPMRVQLVLLGLAVVLFAALVSWWIGRSFSRPLQSMAGAAKAMAIGGPAPPIVHSTITEIAELAAALQQLGAELADRTTTIVRQDEVQGAILASMSEGILAFDADEKVVSCNAAAERILDVDAKVVRGRSLPEVVRNTRLQELVRETLASQEPGQAVVTIVDGEERVALATVRMLHDVDGSYRGVLVVLNDITKQSRLERMRRDFVANVSHELKTPITSIVGSIETLLDGAADDAKDRSKFLEIIKKQSVRLNNLVEDLLNLAHIERLAEKGKVETTPVRLSQLLNSAVTACESIAANRATKVTVQCPPELTARVNARLFEQAIINLVDNAIKYGEPGNNVDVTAQMLDKLITVSVSDHGPGIAPEHLPRIFERFYRAENSRSREFGGTGLGLAIVKHVAIAHGGKVAVDSRRGQGSTFTMTFPQ